VVRELLKNTLTAIAVMVVIWVAGFIVCRAFAPPAIVRAVAPICVVPWAVPPRLCWI
jgi:hypothetical protein